jgi:hypothetical protein
MHRSLTITIVALATALLAAAAGLVAAPPRAHAATSVGCAGGDFTVTLPSGRRLSGYNGWKIAPSELPAHSRLHVQGKYVQFDVDVSDYAVYDYALTGAANPLDMTGGKFTPLFASKVPDLKGRTLDGSELEVSLSPSSLVSKRRGGVSMKIQAKDCATGGIFQVEPEAGTSTVFTHTLAPGVFYFKNPFTGKINLGNGAGLIAKDSPQVATKLVQTDTVSVWDVASGGRMGGVLGEDAVELSQGAANCVQDCQAQNRVRGSLPAPGF